MTPKADLAIVRDDDSGLDRINDPGTEILAALYNDANLFEGVPFYFDGTQLDQPFARIVSTMLREKTRLLDTSGGFDVTLIRSALSDAKGKVPADELNALVGADTHSDPVVAKKLAARAREKQLLQLDADLAGELIEAPGKKSIQAKKQRGLDEIDECRAIIEGDVQRGEDDFQPLQPFINRYGPEMPTELLPNGVREMVEAAAEALQVPSAAMGVWALGSLAFSVSRTFEASPRDGWSEPLNLWPIAALPPASRKSAAIKVVSNPIIEAERDRNEANREEREAAAERVSRLEKRRNRAELDYAKAGPDQAEEAEAQAQQAAEELKAAQADLTAVRRRQYYSSDITPEASAERMAGNDERLVIISAEGDEFFALMRRYGNDSNRPNQDFWLKSHAGDSTRVDRKNAPPIDLEAPALSLVLAVQPSVIEAIREDSEMRERGMTARLLYAVPEPTVGHRKISPPPIPERTAERFDRIVRALLDIGGDRIQLRFDDEANQALFAFETELEPRLAEDADLGPIATWAGKLPGLTVRLAGIFHAVDRVGRGQHPNDSHIGVKTVTDAIGVGRWALEHAAVAMSHAHEADPEAQRVWRWVTGRPDPASEFSARDAFYDARRRGEKMHAFKTALAALVERGYLRDMSQPRARTGVGRQPSPRYQPNPEALIGEGE